ncbi:P pilus assembly chaperone PapD [Pantoea alhagi]|uniref:fimbria/pilus chaperone family protein n=1 Tax=Mixta sp. BE291 TaxID=3158787 RepID=UPI00286245D0|nr:P pilus assembly chaperone PapD [Pantoea alhagi]
MMKLTAYGLAAIIALMLLSTSALATGIQPETSVVIVEESDGEGAINLKNDDPFPLLLLTTLQDVEQQQEKLLSVLPPVARVEPGKVQRIRFIVTAKAPLKTERLMRVVFEGVPPQQKDKNQVRLTVRQNLPVIIRPAGLPPDDAPWKRLEWRFHNGQLSVNNPSPYVIRLEQRVIALPQRADWQLNHPYILPGQRLTLSRQAPQQSGTPRAVRLAPATMWGYSAENYEAPLVP